MLMEVNITKGMCENCQYFYQHYIKNSNGYTYTPCYAGHCVYKRIKQRKPGDTCENYQERSTKNVI